MEDISDEEGPLHFNICKRDTTGYPQEELGKFPRHVCGEMAGDF